MNLDLNTVLTQGIASARELLKSRNGKVGSALAAVALLSYSYTKYVRPKPKGSPGAQANIKRNYSQTFKMMMANRKSDRAEVNREFFTRLRALLRILVPRVRSKEFLLLVLQTLFLCGRTLTSVYVAQLDGYIVKALVSAEFEKFMWGIVYWLLIAIPATYINSMIKYLTNKISIAFRTRLVTHIHDMYMEGNTFYSIMNLDSRVENADQLITQDVNKFCSSISALYCNLAKPSLDVVLFGAQLWAAVGPAGPMLMTAFYLFTGILLRIATPPFGKLAAEEARLEGEFRFAHSRVITNAEEIAFYGGQKVEKGILNNNYFNLIRHCNYVYHKKIWHGMLEGMVIKYLSSVQGLLICAIPVFWATSLGRFGGKFGSGSDYSSRTEDYVRNRRYLISLAEAIGRILYSYKEITELAGFTQRVSTLLTVFSDVKSGRYDKVTSAANEEILATLKGGHVEETDNGEVEFKDVPIVSPNGDVLVRALSFFIQPGMHMIITGPNGCGKSSLFRILGGLWPVLEGTVRKPPSRDIFYIPQRPYLCTGTLRDQIIYPDTLVDMRAKGFSDQQLESLLEKTHLHYVLDREGGWDTIKEWKDVLSGGEKQRVAMARLFYHRPRYAILDECTSQVSIDVEGLMYTYAKDIGITLLTVSHRPSLWQYHTYLLQFDGQGNVKFGKLDVNHRMSLEEEKANLFKILKDMPKQQKRFEELCRMLGDNAVVAADRSDTLSTGSAREARISPLSTPTAAPAPSNSK